MDLDTRETRWLLSEKYNNILSDAYEQDLIKLRSGVPLAYLIGNIPFLGCHIDLSYRPLIPRAETEYWVNRAIKEIEPDKPVRILDLCAGSGCIGIAILKHLPYSLVTFIDNDSECIEQIQENCKLNHIELTRYKIVQSDLYTDLEPSNQFDYIFSNPPYIARERIDTVQTSVHEHENHNALYANDDGLALIKKIIDESNAYLKNDGQVLIEFDPWQKNMLSNLHQTEGFNVSFIKDQFDKYRLIRMAENKRTLS